MLNLSDLQEAVARGWTNEGYSEPFNSSPVFHKDFDHALKHVRKAAQALENMTEAADHGAHWVDKDREAIAKYVADLIISAARLANVSPMGIIDLDMAVIKRLEAKIFPKPGL
jgi:hypothetical protein